MKVQRVEVEQVELFSEAELESLEFMPEELEAIEAERVPDLENISFEDIAEDLEAYFEGGVKQAGLEGRGRNPSRSPNRSPSPNPSRSPNRSPSPNPNPSGKTITIGGREFNQNDFHRILKPKILNYLRGKGVNYRSLGNNPDITVKKGNVVLTGQKGGNKVDTNLSFLQILSELGYQ